MFDIYKNYSKLTISTNVTLISDTERIRNANNQSYKIDLHINTSENKPARNTIRSSVTICHVRSLGLALDVSAATLNASKFKPTAALLVPIDNKWGVVRTSIMAGMSDDISMELQFQVLM